MKTINAIVDNLMLDIVLSDSTFPDILELSISTDVIFKPKGVAIQPNFPTEVQLHMGKRDDIPINEKLHLVFPYQSESTEKVTVNVNFRVHHPDSPLKKATNEENVACSSESGRFSSSWSSGIFELTKGIWQAIEQVSKKPPKRDELLDIITMTTIASVRGDSPHETQYHVAQDGSILIPFSIPLFSTLHYRTLQLRGTISLMVIPESLLYSFKDKILEEATAPGPKPTIVTTNTEASTGLHMLTKPRSLSDSVLDILKKGGLRIPGQIDTRGDNDSEQLTEKHRPVMLPQTNSRDPVATNKANPKLMSIGNISNLPRSQVISTFLNSHPVIPANENQCTSKVSSAPKIVPKSGSLNENAFISSIKTSNNPHQNGHSNASTHVTRTLVQQNHLAANVANALSGSKSDIPKKADPVVAEPFPSILHSLESLLTHSLKSLGLLQTSSIGRTTSLPIPVANEPTTATGQLSSSWRSSGELKETLILTGIPKERADNVVDVLYHAHGNHGRVTNGDTQGSLSTRNVSSKVLQPNVGLQASLVSENANTSASTYSDKNIMRNELILRSYQDELSALPKNCDNSIIHHSLTAAMLGALVGGLLQTPANDMTSVPLALCQLRDKLLQNEVPKRIGGDMSSGNGYSQSNELVQVSTNAQHSAFPPNPLVAQPPVPPHQLETTNVDPSTHLLRSRIQHVVPPLLQSTTTFNRTNDTLHATPVSTVTSVAAVNSSVRILAARASNAAIEEEKRFPRDYNKSNNLFSIQTFNRAVEHMRSRSSQRYEQSSGEHALTGHVHAIGSTDKSHIIQQELPSEVSLYVPKMADNFQELTAIGIKTKQETRENVFQGADHISKNSFPKRQAYDNKCEEIHISGAKSIHIDEINEEYSQASFEEDIIEPGSRDRNVHAESAKDVQTTNSFHVRDTATSLVVPPTMSTGLHAPTTGAQVTTATPSKRKTKNSSGDSSKDDVHPNTRSLISEVNDSSGAFSTSSPILGIPSKEFHRKLEEAIEVTESPISETYTDEEEDFVVPQTIRSIDQMPIASTPTSSSQGFSGMFSQMAQLLTSAAKGTTIDTPNTGSNRPNLTIPLSSPPSRSLAKPTLSASPNFSLGPISSLLSTSQHSTSSNDARLSLSASVQNTGEKVVSDQSESFVSFSIDHSPQRANYHQPLAPVNKQTLNPISETGGQYFSRSGWTNEDSQSSYSSDEIITPPLSPHRSFSSNHRMPSTPTAAMMRKPMLNVEELKRHWNKQSNYRNGRGYDIDYGSDFSTDSEHYMDSPPKSVPKHASSNLYNSSFHSAHRTSWQQQSTSTPSRFPKSHIPDTRLSHISHYSGHHNDNEDLYEDSYDENYQSERVGNYYEGQMDNDSGSDYDGYQYDHHDSRIYQNSPSMNASRMSAMQVAATVGFGAGDDSEDDF